MAVPARLPAPHRERAAHDGCSFPHPGHAVVARGPSREKARGVESLPVILHPQPELLAVVWISTSTRVASACRNAFRMASAVIL